MPFCHSGPFFFRLCHDKLLLVSKDGFDWYLRFDGDPDKPLHCQLQGKRKSSTKILVSSGCSPSMDSSPTGCY